MNFTFTRHRLILGMKCGIVVVSGMIRNELTYNVSILQDEHGEGTNRFPDPVNKISASACCSKQQCNYDDLVAAYSFSAEREPEENKFIYVSFDRGNKFEKRIVSSRHSPVNLIKGLYQLYKGWNQYYEILEEPQQEDHSDDDALLRSLRLKPIWNTILTEEKERMFAVGVPRKMKRMRSLRKIVEILETRVPKRIQRLKSNGTDVDKDISPSWVNVIREERLKNTKGYKEDWTYENCDQIPECKEKFEDDKAVDWLLKGADIHVKTPKRDVNEPFCKEIVSILVISEESHVLALCSIGYGENGGDPGGTGSTDVQFFALFNFAVKVRPRFNEYYFL